MMTTRMPQISYIDFWKRNPNSVESIDSLEIKIEGKNWFLDTKKGNRPLSEEEISKLQDGLDEIRNDGEDEFRAFLYEDKQSDYSLKFFLNIQFSNHTYYAIKGRYPFKQKNYQAINNLFSPLLEN